ncbi:hypothetical protein JOD45_000829 [Scopulibacillus daqui]|uniref:YfhD-like protein n=1 Tax=Scopulibacillus daqui TaxID=1469162 RepID=A0ABS2PXF1_9BACL|nr:hypothetical protein [Scopulibacillus daqui]MBM7644636.1 hypothetical protein [Scopulibacillus daqui]
MAKRKQPREAARNNNFTPTESMANMDLTDKTFAEAEIPEKLKNPHRKEE